METSFARTGCRTAGSRKGGGTWPRTERAGPRGGAGRTCLEVGELQKLVRLAALEVGQYFAAGLRLAEGWQALLAALEAVRSAQQASEEAQLRVAGEARGGLGLGHHAAVAVAEGLAVAQQTVQPQADLQVAHALRPVLAAVLVQGVPVGRLERHQLVPREAAEAVALVLGAHGEQRATGAQQHQQRHGSPASRLHHAWWKERRKEVKELEGKEEEPREAAGRQPGRRRRQPQARPVRPPLPKQTEGPGAAALTGRVPWEGRADHWFPQCPTRAGGSAVQWFGRQSARQTLSQWIID